MGSVLALFRGPLNPPRNEETSQVTTERAAL